MSETQTVKVQSWSELEIFYRQQAEKFSASAVEYQKQSDAIDGKDRDTMRAKIHYSRLASKANVQARIYHNMSTSAKKNAWIDDARETLARLELGEQS
jgi:hypothetical protein